MIKFFRKIRHRLLKEKRFSGYLTYAIGEVLLVVVGILLALQFNNWNQERANKEKEEWYLENIAEDIEYQRGDLEDMKEDFELSIKLGKEILKEYNRLGSFAKVDSLNHKLNLLMISDNFPNINGTYQELVNSGQQSIIQDKDLSVDIIDYFLFCDDNEIDFNINNENVFYKDIYPVFSELHQQNMLELDLPPEEQYLLVSDERSNAFIQKKLEEPENILKLLNALRTNILIDDYHLSMVVETLEIGKELTEKIDKYLGITPDMLTKNNREDEEEIIEEENDDEDS